MKAVYVDNYGGPEMAYIKTIDIPKINEDEILINVKATTVNSADSRIRGLDVDNCCIRLIIRCIFGCSGPRNPILGCNGSGIVVKIGKNIKQFCENDEVFFNTGSKMGCHSQFIKLNEKDVILQKPSNLNFQESASIIFGTNTALYFLNQTKLVKDEYLNVLLYGATSSTGVSAIQICKYYNAQVTCVCSTEGIELVKRLGCDSVIDYKKDDFTKKGIKYDIIFDCIGKITKDKCKDVLIKNGEYLSVDSFDVANDSIDLLKEIKKLAEKNVIKPVIDKIYNLDEIVDAYRYVDSYRKKGNVVLEIK